jgi:hypothetical protein
MNRPLPKVSFILATALAALALSGTGALALDLGGHDRDGVTIGVAMGAGWNKMDFSIPTTGGDVLQYETATTVDFQGGINVGWARSDHLMGTIGFYGWKEGGWVGGGNPLTVTTFHFLAEAYLFPRGQGFWLKGGVGAGTLDFTAVTPAERITFQEGGWNFVAGAGYEFRVADTAAIGFAYDYRYLTVGAFEGLEDTSVSSQNASMSIRYYMD